MVARCGWVCLLLLVQQLVGYAQAGGRPVRIRSGQQELAVSPQGELVAWTDHQRHLTIALTGRTVLADTKAGAVTVKKLAGGAVAFSRLVSQAGHAATLTERFTPENGAFRWDIELEGNGKPWSTAVQTTWQVPEAAQWKCWTSWGDPRLEQTDVAMSETEARNLLDGTVGVVGKGLPNTNWADPLVPQPFTNRQLWYGGPIYGKPQADGSASEVIYYNPIQLRNFFSVPLMTVLNEQKNWALTLGFSPEDIGIEALLRTSQDGRVTFSRHNNRIGGKQKLRFTTYLVAHEADWRAGLGWYSRRFAAFFNPILPVANDFAGTGAYSWETKKLDVPKLRDMAFKTNWDATFPFIYMGQFLPPLRDDEMWLSWRGLATSFKTINDYYVRMQRDGFHVLSYFDVTEYGNYVMAKKDYVNRKDWRQPWYNCNKYLQDVMEPAVVYHPDDTTFTQYIYTYEKAVVVDPAEPVYTKFMLEQARRHLEKLPNFEGFAIDRMDWNRMYNLRRDDGVTWFNGQPCRSLHTSWNIMMDSLHHLLHPRGKVIFLNNHVKRLEQTRYADGVFDEFGYGGASINTNALLCLNKTLIGWCYDKTQIGADADGYMQRYLHLGMFPMAPFPGNDHAILPDPEVELLFTDYGQLFTALRGKKWVLEANAVSVVDNRAKVNLFQTPEGYIAPVTFGGTNPTVSVRLKQLTPAMRPEYLQPGERTWHPLQQGADGLLTVPLKRGCALIRIKPVG